MGRGTEWLLNSIDTMVIRNKAIVSLKDPDSLSRLKLVWEIFFGSLLSSVKFSLRSDPSQLANPASIKVGSQVQGLVSEDQYFFITILLVLPPEHISQID
jgi:hypothetical protein